MARYTACEGTIKAGSTPGTVGQVTSWNLDESNSVKRFFELGNCTEQTEPGGTSRTLGLEVNFDPDDTGQGEFAIGTEVDVEVYPIGDTTGNKYYAMTGIVESRNQSGSGDDFLTMSLSIAVNSYAEQTVA